MSRNRREVSEISDEINNQEEVERNKRFFPALVAALPFVAKVILASLGITAGMTAGVMVEKELIKMDEETASIDSGK